MRAAGRFARHLADDGLLPNVARVRIELYGSLGATGAGHGTPGAVMLGLEGCEPETVDPAAAHARVDEIMTRDVLTCGPDDTVDSLAETMTERRIRHMPVLDHGRLAGIVSIGDVVKSHIRQLETDREQLESYISHG